jgi:hypothetical protein
MPSWIEALGDLAGHDIVLVRQARMAAASAPHRAPEVDRRSGAGTALSIRWHAALRIAGLCTVRLAYGLRRPPRSVHPDSPTGSR